MCAVHLQGKYKSSLPFCSISVFPSLCVSPLLLVFLHPPQGTARTAAVPMTTSVLLSITKAALSSSAYITRGLLGFDRCADGSSHNCIARINKCTPHYCRTDINLFMSCVCNSVLVICLPLLILFLLSFITCFVRLYAAALNG